MLFFYFVGAVSALTVGYTLGTWSQKRSYIAGYYAGRRDYLTEREDA